MEVQYKEELMKYLLKELKGYSRNNIKSLLKFKQVRVNGKSINQFNHMLNVGDIIEISKYRADDSIEILYEDEYFVAINKPANILSVRNTKGEFTAISMILEYLDKSNVNAKAFILHRLDKATSGVFIVAKTEEIKNIMQNDWNNIVKVRGYYAVVSGVVSKSGKIVSYLSENSDGYVFSSEDGKEAITNYKVMKKGVDYSLLDVKIETGRKNQIRVHMKELGHPVLGDLKYGEKSHKIKRLALHAYRFDFVHPVTKKRVNIECKKPNEFNRF